MMDNKTINDIEISPPSVVKQAARHFASVLAETSQFKSFEQAVARVQQDATAQQAMEAFKEKQMAWRVLIMLNALSVEQHTDLESLKNVFVNQPVV